jgi:hypothetical protein
MKIWLAVILTGYFILGLKEIPEVATVINPDRFWSLQVSRAERGVKAREHDLRKMEGLLCDHQIRRRGKPEAKAIWYPPEQRLPRIFTLKILTQGAAENVTRAKLQLISMERQWREAASTHPWCFGP